jgi:16S rRNA (cytidine1402-2'-O)-methyltransferase
LSGTLYIVSTPIGNLEDITFRAVRILKEVDLIACEDTRHTRHLLDHYGIGKPLVSYHEHNERERTVDLVTRLQGGQNIAVVSDAGTPLLSDPGYRVVEAAVSAGLPVVAIPGASAVLTALAASGLSTDAFYFGGFLPAKTGQRKRVLEAVADVDCVLAFYEAPHRLVESLRAIAQTLGARTVVVARELTKLHEEYARGAASELQRIFAERPAVKGEITILIGKPVAPARDAGSIREMFDLHVAQGMSRMDAMKAAARDCGVSKREVYAELEKG